MTNRADSPQTVWQNRHSILTAALNEVEAITKNVATQREDALKKLIKENKHEALRNSVLKAYLLETAQIHLCQSIVPCLNKFADEAVTYFINGFYGKEASLPEPSIFRPGFVLETVLSQVAYDLNVIEHAINQRRRLEPEKMTKQGLTLALADQCGMGVIERFVDSGFLPENTKLVSYLGENIRTRLVPYDETILLRVAFASLHKGHKPTRDFLAIHHEIGHHVYWNGRIPQTDTPIFEALQDALKKHGIYSRNWRLHWLEEMFADAVALLLGGPVVVLDFQDMLVDDMPHHFKSDTDKHPIPAIRPLLQTQILRSITDQAGEAVYHRTPKMLDEHWEDQWVGKDIHTEPFRIRHHKPRPCRAIVDDLQVVIDVILDVLRPLAPQSKNDPAILSSDSVAHVSEMYDNFHDERDHQGYGWLEAYYSTVAKNGFVDEGVKGKFNGRFACQYKSFAQRVKELSGALPDEFAHGDWIDQFLREGWSTEGPEGDFVGKG